MPARPSAKAGKGAGGTLRIIGGRWRGRRLAFPEVEGLRPTPDRVRETLFNWLQPVVAGARCLDLFAGSGALGLEALSRGAAEVVLVDNEPRAVARLREHLVTLGYAGSEPGAPQGQVCAAAALRFLAQTPPPRGYDIVFLDPPFRRDLLAACCAALEQGGWLAPGARIYLEAEAEGGAPALPPGWEMARARVAGQVGYYLAVRAGAPEAARAAGGSDANQGGLSG